MIGYLQPTSFEQLQERATQLDLGNFEILLCVGNKADRVPEHFAHTEYRRKLQKKGESSSDPHPEFGDFGISRTEGSSLLDEESVSAEDRRRSCAEWCSDNGFEYIEVCASDEVFDECKSPSLLKSSGLLHIVLLFLCKGFSILTIYIRHLSAFSSNSYWTFFTGMTVDGDLQGVARIH